MLKPNTTYYFRVKAVNQHQESNHSNIIQVTTLDSPLAYITPEPAKSPIIHSVKSDSNRAYIYLHIPTTEEYIEEYKLTVSIFNDYSSPIYDKLTYIRDFDTTIAWLENVKVIVIPIFNLSPNLTYYVRITAVNSNGLSGNTDISFSTIEDLGIPIVYGSTNLTATTATINWSKITGATSYAIDLDDNIDFTSPIINNLDVGDVDFYNVPVLVENTRYYYRVRAKNSTKTSASSSLISFTTLDNVETYDDLSYDLSPPSIKAVEAVFTDRFIVKWNNVSKSDNYTIDVSVVPDFSSFVLQDIVVLNSFYSVTSLSPSTVYYFRVKANNSAKSSSYTTQIVTTLTEDISLTVPSLLTPTLILSFGASIAWVKRTYASSYKIDISTVDDFSSIYKEIFVNDVDSYFIDDLEPDTTYYVRIYGLNSVTSSSASTSISFTTTTSLPTISLLPESEVTNYSFRLNWELDPAFDNYAVTVYKKVDLARTNYLGNGFFKSLEVGNVSTYLVNLFLEPGITYNYYITGISSNGDRIDSDKQEINTLASPPILQLSVSGALLEWSGDISHIEVSNNKEFSGLVKGYNPRNVTGLAELYIGNLLESAYNYYIRGYKAIDGVEGIRSNVISTISSYPTFLPPVVTDTTATIKWIKSEVEETVYSIQVYVDNAGNYIPISGHSLPVVIGDVSEYQLKNLTVNTHYRVYLNWYSDGKFTKLEFPLEFKTNKHSEVSDVSESGVATSASILSFDFDRVTIDLGELGDFLVEVSKRSDFLTKEYFEFLNVEYVTLHLDSETTYYLNIYKDNGATRTPVQLLSVTTSSPSNYGAVVASVPNILDITVLNETEATVSFSEVTDALGYRLEVSKTDTFDYLVKSLDLYFITDTKVLISNLLPGSPYYIRVAAFSDNSISEYSNYITLTT